MNRTLMRQKCRFRRVKKCSSILSQIYSDNSHIPLSYSDYLLDEPEGLESIYRAVIRNTEREMKLRALCGAPLPANNFSKTNSNEATKNPGMDPSMVLTHHGKSLESQEN